MDSKGRLKQLLDLGVRVYIAPADMPANELIAIFPDGGREYVYWKADKTYAGKKYPMSMERHRLMKRIIELEGADSSHYDGPRGRIPLDGHILHLPTGEEYCFDLPTREAIARRRE